MQKIPSGIYKPQPISATPPPMYGEQVTTFVQKKRQLQKIYNPDPQEQGQDQSENQKKLRKDSGRSNSSKIFAHSILNVSVWVIIGISIISALHQDRQHALYSRIYSAF